MAGTSVSEEWRDKGNQVFKSATPALSQALRESKLQEASRSYYRAVETAQGDLEKSSGAKNHAVVDWKLASIYGDQDKKDLMIHHFKQCLKYMTIAYRTGLNVQSLEWQQALNTNIYGCAAECMSIAMTSPDRKIRGRMLEKFIPLFIMPENQIEAYMELAKIYFDSSVDALDEKDYKAALIFLKECYRPIEELKRIGSEKADVISEVRVMSEDILLQTCVAESLQARTAGDSLVQSALRDYEDLPIALLWDAADWYRRAIVLTREKEVVIEAISWSRLGNLYHEMLRIKHLARACYKQCILLANSVPQKCYDSEDWYQKSAQILEEYQKATVQAEQERDADENATVKEELKPEIKELETALSKGDAAFLEYVYGKYKPLNEEHGLIDNYKDNMQKAFQKAVIHYHPDKVNVETNGRRLKVLYGEIDKLLTSRYEHYKGF